MPSPAPSQDPRDRLIEATVRLLSESGPSAIRARQVTAEVGVSTMAIYQHFGGMSGLIEAVADDGFRRLGKEFEECPETGDLVTDAMRMALVHREVALENPHLYDLMFGLSNPGGHLPRSSEQQKPVTPGFVNAYGQLIDLASGLVESKRVRREEPEVVAAQLWSFAHGYITLELAGHMANFVDPVAQVLLPLGANIMVGLGDERDRAESSAAAALADTR